MNAAEYFTRLANRFRSLVTDPPNPGELAEPAARTAGRVAAGGGRAVVVRRTPTGATVTISGPHARQAATAARRAATASTAAIAAAARAETVRRLL